MAPPPSGSTQRDCIDVLDLLIIECDCQTLKRQGLSVAQQLDWAAAIGLYLDSDDSPGCYRVLHVADKLGLLEGLRDVCDQYDAVRGVLLVGHSNEHGLQMAPAHFVRWAGVGRYLQPLKPTYLALLACEAGLKPAMAALSSEVSTLQEVAASPFGASKRLAIFLGGWLFVRARDFKLEQDVVRYFQLLQSLGSGDVPFVWRREELHDARPKVALLHDLLLAGATALRSQLL